VRLAGRREPPREPLRGARLRVLFAVVLRAVFFAAPVRLRVVEAPAPRATNGRERCLRVELSLDAVFFFAEAAGARIVRMLERRLPFERLRAG